MFTPRYILVMSGKGGVGKSTTAANLARTIAKAKGSCGLLDLDLTGPSVPTLFGLKGADIKNRGGRMIPCKADNVEIISLGLLLSDPNDAIIWRGPRKHGMIASFFQLIEWTCPIVVVDLPPGTSDEHLSTFDILKQKGIQYHCVIVTTPSILAVADVRKGINLCKQIGAPIVGLIENFSGVLCPCCNEISPLHGESAAKQLGDEMGIPVLANIPFIPAAAAAADQGSTNETILSLFEPLVYMI